MSLNVYDTVEHFPPKRHINLMEAMLKDRDGTPMDEDEIEAVYYNDGAHGSEGGGGGG